MGQSKKSRSTTKKEEPQALFPIQSVPELTAGRTRIILALSTFILALSGYWLTIARTVTLVDSGELILSCSTLSVAHPPGFPLYTFLGFFFSKLPLGSVAARVAFMSAFFAALTAAFLALITIELGALFQKQIEVHKEKSDKRNTESLISKLGSQSDLFRVFEWGLPISVGLVYAFSVTCWFYASVAEVYTLNIALLSVVMYLMLRWYHCRRFSESHLPSQEEKWCLWGATFVYGLALGVHHVTILLTFPAFVALVWSTAGFRYFRSRQVWVAFATGCLALVLVYLYLPLAASRQPVLNWGNPSTLKRFYAHISGWQYQVNLFSGSSEVVIRELKGFGALVFQQFTPLGLFVALIGFWGLWKRDRRLLFLPALVLVLDVLYSINYEIAEDKDAYYLTTNLALVITLGVGLRFLFEWLGTKSKLLAGAVCLLMIALPIANIALHYFESNKSRSLIARGLVENVFSNVEPNGLLLTLDWQLYSPYLYLRHVENFRRDATVVDVNLLRRSWYIEGYLKREYPQMMQSCSAEAQAFLEDLSLFEAGKPYDPPRIQQRFLALINAFVKFHMQNHAVCFTLPMEEGVGSDYTWVPQGLIMHLYPKMDQPNKDQAVKPEFPIKLDSLADQSVYLDEVTRKKVIPFYATMLANRGKYLSLAGRNEEGFQRIRLALVLNPEFDRAYEFLGDVYSAQGMVMSACEAYQNAIKLNPYNGAARKRLEELTSPKSTENPGENKGQGK